ncbi:MAG: hypothetical protein AN481_19965, partial [Aphanizomenon flos-aquae LD13]
MLFDRVEGVVPVGEQMVHSHQGRPVIVIAELYWCGSRVQERPAGRHGGFSRGSIDDGGPSTGVVAGDGVFRDVGGIEYWG